MGQFTKRMTGSINVTKLMDALNKQHSSVRVGTNGATYANVTIWLDLDAPDQNGNNISITLNSMQNMQAQDDQKCNGKVYVLNGKWPQPKQQPVQGQQWQQQQPANNWNTQQQRPQPQQGYQPQQNGYQQQQPQNGYQQPQTQPNPPQSYQNGGYMQQPQTQTQQGYQQQPANNGGGYQQQHQQGDLPF